MRAQNIFDIAVFDSGLYEVMITDDKPHALTKKESATPRQKPEKGFVYQTINSFGLPIIPILSID